MPRSSHGSVVRYGDSTFVNADCIDGAAAHLADNSVDLIITDPPYGIRGDQLHAHYNRDERFVVDGYIEVPAEQYNAFSRAWIAQAARVLKPGGHIYIVSGYSNLYDILDALRATDLREVNHLIWKYNFGVYTSTKYVSSHYHILYYQKPGGKRRFNAQSRFARDERHADGGSANYKDRENVWTINREYKPGREKNKNELPKALLQKMLQYSSAEGDVVCDFFMGGCSTAAVAIAMNHRFIGFEKSSAIFASRVPTVNRVVPGEMLASLRAPQAYVVENQGKPWSPQEIQHLLHRFDALTKSGSTKKQSVAVLCAEFKRGSFAIAKLLKQHANSTISMRPVRGRASSVIPIPQRRRRTA